MIKWLMVCGDLCLLLLFSATLDLPLDKEPYGTLWLGVGLYFLFTCMVLNDYLLEFSYGFDKQEVIREAQLRLLDYLIATRTLDPKQSEVKDG